MKLTPLVVGVMVFVGLGATGCASTGQRLADVAKPNSVLPVAALECAKLAGKDSQTVCLQGVLAEAERAGRTAEAAALAVTMRRGYPYDYYGGGYGYGGYGYGGGYRGVIPYP